ncbi:murein L,D-transpeptidase [Limoniibacter endophyticus]|uniref:Murein L,D-transpeptidase n=2 Tax=Limoniibacter endophyticus TaxID=1565040 RepID=A0A8J3DRT3_9HYPH|nr:murein L,D-transpeptidase [Limoniibacter endophyticus]
MRRSPLLVTFFLAGSCLSAFAQDRSYPAGEVPVQLAQSRGFGVYYDEYGNRVLVDNWTGEVVSVQPRGERRYGRRPYEEGVPGEAYPERPRDYPPREYDAPSRYDDRYYANTPEYGDYGYGEEPSYGGQGARPGYQERYQQPPERQGSIIRRPLNAEPSAPPPAAERPARPPSEIITEPQDQPRIEVPARNGARTQVAELQVLLDRVGASPGAIDGRFGSNLEKALESYAQITGLVLRSTDAESITKALEQTGGEAFTEYVITPEDVAGPYVASVPADYGEKAKLDRLSYTSVTEMLGERFHMDQDYLKSINPGVNFNRPGTKIRVVNVGKPRANEVVRIVADKGRKQVLGYGADGSLVVAYPATIGSSDTPSPTGTHKVERIAINPQYTYNPKVNFKQGNNDRILTIPPGPNGPVGSVWIALSKPTYGIHGTPEPSQIGKTSSHGCVRLTNWDAQELAKLVKPGVEVEFRE